MYKKGLVFLVPDTVKDITSHSLKLLKLFTQIPNTNLFQCIPQLSPTERDKQIFF